MTLHSCQEDSIQRLDARCGNCVRANLPVVLRAGAGALAPRSVAGFVGPSPSGCAVESPRRVVAPGGRCPRCRRVRRRGTVPRIPNARKLRSESTVALFYAPEQRRRIPIPPGASAGTPQRESPRAFVRPGRRSRTVPAEEASPAVPEETSAHVVDGEGGMPWASV